MKTCLLLTAAGLSLATTVFADVEVTMTEVRRLGFLPQDKADYRPEDKMDIKRRNPFAERAPKVTAAKEEDQTETEESRIRAYFRDNPVRGIMKFGDKYVATVGRLSLEAGQPLPPIIQGQTQILRVMRVDKSVVELGWVENVTYDAAAPRKITLRVDLEPRIRQVIASAEAETETFTDKNTYLVDGNGKVVRPTRADLMPDPTEIATSLPPGSDTDPDSFLSTEEQQQMSALETAQTGQDPALSGALPPPSASDVPPPPAETETVPAQLTPDIPPLPAEDEVQQDPDMTAPPAAPTGPVGGSPAGAP
jgi:hypothetical protein